MPLIASPSMLVFGNEQERRAFNFFRDETGKSLSDSLDLSHLTQFLLQACHFSDTLRPAVLSLGSISERLYLNPVLMWDNEQANAYHQFARTEYGKALRRAREEIDRSPQQSRMVVVVSCLLFTMFEFLQGNRSATLTHLRAGCKFICEEASWSNGSFLGQQAKTELNQEIKRAFSTVDKQVTLWLGLDSPISSLLVPYKRPKVEDTVTRLDGLSGIEEVSASFVILLEEIFNHDQCSLTSWQPPADQSQIPSGIEPERKLIWARLGIWHAQLSALRDSLGVSIDIETLHRIFVLEMNFVALFIGFSVCFEQDQTHWHHEEDIHFRRVISLATAVLLPVTEEVTKRMHQVVLATNGTYVTHTERRPLPAALISLYIGIIPPLYTTATQCQNPELRGEAIALLESRPWREGVWDSVALAREAQRTWPEFPANALPPVVKSDNLVHHSRSAHPRIDRPSDSRRSQS